MQIIPHQSQGKQTKGEVHAALTCKAECFQLTPNGFSMCFQKAESGNAEVEKRLDIESETYRRFSPGLTVDLCLCVVTAVSSATLESDVSTET